MRFSATIVARIAIFLRVSGTPSGIQRCSMRPYLTLGSGCRLRRFRDDLHLVAVRQVHQRLQDDLVSVRDAGVDLDLGAVSGDDRNLAQVRRRL